MADEETTVDDTSDSGEDLSALLSSASLMLFIGSLASLSRLVEQVAMGRLLSPAAYGEVTICIAVMTLANRIGTAGFSQGIPRFMTRFEDAVKTRGAWVTGALIAGIATTVVTLVLLVSVPFLEDLLLEPDTPEGLLVLFVIAVPFVVLLGIATSMIRGHENTIYRTYTRDLLYSGVRIVIIVGLLLAGFGVVAAGYAYIVAAAVASGVAIWLVNKLAPLVGPFELNVKEMTLFSLPLVISSTVSIILGRMDTLMLGYYLPSAQAGIYNAAYPIAQAVTVITSSFGFLFMPLMSRLDAGGKREEINHLYKITTKWVFVVTFPAVLCIVVFPDDLLGAIFGAEYTAGATALAVVAGGFFISASFGRCQDALSAFGYTTYILAINVASAALNLVLNAVLIAGYGPLPDLGIEGAAAASALSFISLNLLALIVLWYESGVNPVSRASVQTFVLLPLVLGPPSLWLAGQTTLSLPALIAFVPIAGIVSIVVLAVTGSFQADDIIPVELIEDNLGFEIPLIRRYIPDDTEPTEVFDQ